MFASFFAAGQEPAESNSQPSVQPLSQTQEKNEDCVDLAEEHRSLIAKYNELVTNYKKLSEIAQEQEKYIEESEVKLKSLEQQIDNSEVSETAAKKETDVVDDLIKQVISLHPLGALLVTLIDAAPEPAPPQ